MNTDASKSGWGCAVNNLTTGGLWTSAEASQHINYLEMLAVLLSLKAYKEIFSGKHVKVMVFNTTAQTTINNMGTSHSPQLNSLAKSIWDLCMSRQIWLTVARIPCPENIEADRESRTSRRCTEWCLNRNIFLKACKKLKFSPNIDLFASRINYQVKPFVSYRADPEALAINAFHLSWQNYKFYVVLVLCHLSGNASRAEVFLQELQRSSKHLGEQVLESNIQPTYNGGDYTAVKGILIPFSHL